MKKVVRKKILALPNLTQEIGTRDIPELGGDDYLARIGRVRSVMGSFTHLVIYGDREHYSNVEYFSGYDPRFEETLLIIPREGELSIIVGNEGDSYANLIGYSVRKFIYPTFSLPGQPRSQARLLESVLRLVGLDESSHIGLIGWKLFTREDLLNPDKAFDLPYFIMESLLKVVPLTGVRNAAELMMGLAAGLRITLEAKELLMGEFTGTLSSRGTYRVLEHLREGMTEVEASEHLGINGMPLSVHPNINFGKNLSYGLASPMHGAILKHGDIVGVGMAYRRSLCHKVGYFIDGPGEEPEARKAFYDRYFRTMAAWYESLGIGVTGGQVYDAADSAAGGLADLGIGLNPGHLIHTDEWTNSLFKPACDVPLRSGMMVQCDFTAAKADDNLIAHAEDGVLLADEATRGKLAQASPLAWQRIQARRKFMTGELGIAIREEVLPTSDLPGVIFPYLCDLGTVLAFE